MVPAGAGPSFTQGPPGIRVVGGVAFALVSVFMVLANVPETVPAGLTVAGMVGVIIAGSVLCSTAGRALAGDIETEATNLEDFNGQSR